ncbi:hypothetical protein MPTK1_3g12570 [Marchantia polymorpha subsp. ruderalis]|nr:hypothetical protein MARPO_0278s0003 [Marchantia polymorpha]PTQ38593.1 hypothetical protein MARPO_0050s0054 [Marchantia polymorpha]BBN05374.1 hypothetical protein Mp_3g12570 [Marchantia polymorpha subsp. ruderalis]BBN05375.1 hypothetical protein Mp_3g12580 [Marchantia polymorpha subsp. ruderalis]|eukprot:PTQ26889.1 hypothetical protein MARPO_0278s0003 [Marchantia polymorpha]
MARQGRSIPLLVLVAFGVLAVLVEKASAMDFYVGDTTGWGVPNEATTYQDWASNKTFLADDVLVFQYQQGTHNVLQVSKKSFENCTISSPIDKFESGNDRVTLIDSDYYFICGISIHCTLNQKLHVIVSNKSEVPAPPSSPLSPPPKASPLPPPGSSASALQPAGALISMLMMVGIASLAL